MAPSSNGPGGVRDRVARAVERLPALETSAFDLMALAGDPEATADDAAEIVLYDPALAAGELLADREGENLVEVERDLLGLDHAAVGRMALEHWGLPDKLAAAVEHHHGPGGDDPLTHTLLLVDMAAHLSHDEGHPLSPDVDRSLHALALTDLAALVPMERGTEGIAETGG